MNTRSIMIEEIMELRTVVILFPLFWLSSHALCWSVQDDTEIYTVSISAFVTSHCQNRRKKTTYHERATRENVDAGGASARRDTNRRRNINELDFDFDLFSLIHYTDLEAHDDERDRSYERESHADEPRGIAISPILRVIAVMTRREPLVALNHVLLLYS